MDFLELAYEKPKVEPKKWMQGKHLELVTVDTLSRVIDECIESGLYACDLETTGLNRNTYSTKIAHDRTKDSIVGICLSPDGHKGYYLPVRHKKGEEHNLPVTKVESEIRRLVASPAIAIFHNAKFDAEFLQFAGGDPIGLWDDPRKWEDTLILAYLRDTREKNKGLKALSKKELGFEMIELKELYPDDHKGGFDFSELDPSWEPVLWYAASDAICTYCLYQVLAPVILKGSPDRAKQDQVYLLEKLCLPATRWMERVGIPTNQDKVTELIRLGQEEFYSCLHDVYSFCETALGRDVAPGWFRVLEQKKDLANSDYNINLQIDDARLEAKRKLLDARDEKGHFIKVTVEKDGETKEWPEKYDILSRPQLGPLFEELEIPDLNRTEKSGQVQTTQGEIERLNEKHGAQYPFLPKIKRMGELQKALGTYLISLRRDVGPDGCIHPNYNQLGTDTGRYTTPSSKNPDQDGGTKFPIHGTPATYDKSRPECLLRIREAFTVRSPDHVMVAIDFGGVELRIATNYSREPKWIREYFRCSSCNHQFDPGDGTSTPLPPPAYCPRCGSDKIGDLHSATAIAFYGEDKVGTKEFKQLRQQSKGANFALAYGGGPHALMRATGCDENEAARHHRTFNQTYSVLKGWWDEIKGFARRHGYVPTAFGRQYPLPDIKLPISPKEEPDPLKRQMNKKFRSKAERNATNGPIQGFSADLTKLAMGLIYKEVKNRDWFDKVHLLITIHDELVFELHKSIAVEAIERFQEIMTRSPAILKLNWPVPLTTDCEIGFDWTVPYDVKDFRFRLVRRDGMQMDPESKKETGKIWPKELLDIFGPKYGYFDDEGSVVETTATQESTEPTAPTQSPARVDKAPASPVPRLVDGEPYEYRLRNWSLGTAEKLASVIVDCAGRGSHPLSIKSPTGEDALWPGARIMVNPIEFEATAKAHKL